MDSIRFVILTVSDSCSRGEKQDKAGPQLEFLIRDHFPQSIIEHTGVVPDDKNEIAHFLKTWSSNNKCDVIFTTGGTGFSPRDVTPEATKDVIEREAQGISFAMLCKSLEVTDMAMLSRAVCGIKNETLIVNFPGSTKAVTECFGFIKKTISHAVALLKSEVGKVEAQHKEIQNISPSKVVVSHVAQRSRRSPYPMVEVPEAINLILEETSNAFETEVVDISQTLRRILAEDVFARDPLPPFPASMKDGYAVLSSDETKFRKVRGAIGAGDELTDRPLQTGEVIRISTGAAVPPGADAVVMVEDTSLIKYSEDGTDELEIAINAFPKPGQDIRPTGSDIAANSLVLKRGQLLTAGHIGVLATVGHVSVKVYKKPGIGVVSTGNELQNPHEKLKPGHVRDSNKLTLLNLLRQYGYEATDAGIAKDNPDSVKAVLTKAFDDNDVVITTGGVSMGEFDVVKQVLLEDFDAKIHFGRVNVKPGKPTTFATCLFNGKRKLIFSLPGNPVSAMVTCILFVLPSLKKLENQESFEHSKVAVSLQEKMPLDPRPEYIRASLRKNGEDNLLRALPTGNQISSRINSFVGASALVRLPGKNTEGFADICPKGTILEAILLEPAEAYSEYMGETEVNNYHTINPENISYNEANRVISFSVNSKYKAKDFVMKKLEYLYLPVNCVFAIADTYREKWGLGILACSVFKALVYFPSFYQITSHGEINIRTTLDTPGILALLSNLVHRYFSSRPMEARCDYVKKIEQFFMEKEPNLDHIVNELIINSQGESDSDSNGKDLYSNTDTDVVEN